MPVTVQGPDGKQYQFPDSTTKDQAIAYFKKKGIGATPAGPSASPSGMAEMRATPAGPMQWLQNLQGDVKTGSGFTLPGRVLQKMGAKGTDAGVPEAVGDLMPGGGTIQGGAKVAQGALKIGEGHPIRGANEILRGFGQAAAPIIGVTNPEFLPAAVGYGAAGAATQAGAQAVGVSPDTSEFLGNVVTGLLGGKSLLGKSAEKTTAKLSFASGKGTAAPIAEALNDVKSVVSQTGPPKTVGEFLQTVNTAKSKLNAEYANTLGPNANKQVMPKAISDRILDLITPNMKQTAQGRAEEKAIRAAAVEFQKPWTLAQLDAERMAANGRTSAFEKKNLLDQYAATKGKRTVAIDKAIADGVRDTVYPEMDKLAGKPAGYYRDLKSRIGSMLQLESALNDRVSTLHDQTMQLKGAPRFSRATVRGNVGESGSPRFWVSNLLSAIHTPNPETAANHAVRGSFPNQSSAPLILSLPIKSLLTGNATGPLPPNHPLAQAPIQ